MANLRKWTGGWTSRGTVLTTELNSLADAGYSSAGTSYDNTTNGNQIGKLVISLASLAAAAGAYLQAFITEAPDGTNYTDPPKSTNPAFGDQNLGNSVDNSTSTKLVEIGPFLIPPGKMKFVLRNKCGVALASSGNTATLYTTDETNNG